MNFFGNRNMILKKRKKTWIRVLHLTQTLIKKECCRNRKPMSRNWLFEQKVAMQNFIEKGWEDKRSITGPVCFFNNKYLTSTKTPFQKIKKPY